MLASFYSPRGRIGRLEWWVCSTIVSVLFFGMLFWMLSFKGKPSGLPISFGLLFLATALSAAWANFCVTTRRLHDLGRSAWWYTWLLVPLVGPILLFAVCAFFPGAEGANRYGASLAGGRAYDDSDRWSATHMDELIRRHAADKAAGGASMHAQRQPVIVEKRSVPAVGGQRRPGFGRRGLA